MDEIRLLDAVERYIRGEMTPDERLHFEQLRKTNADVAEPKWFTFGESIKGSLPLQLASQASRRLRSAHWFGL